MTGANCEFEVEHPSMDLRRSGVGTEQSYGGDGVKWGYVFKPKDWDSVVTALGGAFVATANIELYSLDEADVRIPSRWVLLDSATITAPLPNHPVGQGYSYQAIAPFRLRPNRAYAVLVTCPGPAPGFCWREGPPPPNSVPRTRNIEFVPANFPGIATSPTFVSHWQSYVQHIDRFIGYADVEVTTQGPLRHDHSVCTTGSALVQGADWCADAVCAAEPSCCTGSWTSACVSRVASSCGKTCSDGRIAGLVPGCDGSGVCLGRMGESCADTCARSGQSCDPNQVPSFTSGPGGVELMEHFGQCPQSVNYPSVIGDYYVASQGFGAYSCFDTPDATLTSYSCDFKYENLSRLCYCVDNVIAPAVYASGFGSTLDGWTSDFSATPCTGGTMALARICDSGCRARMRIRCPNQENAWFYMLKRFDTTRWNTSTRHKVMLSFEWRCQATLAAANICGYRIYRDNGQVFTSTLTNGSTADTGYQHFGPVDVTAYVLGANWVEIQMRIRDAWTGDHDHKMLIDNVYLYLE